MESADHLDAMDYDDEFTMPSSGDSNTLVQVENGHLETSSEKIRPTVDTEDRYLQQRAPAPKHNTFNPATHSHAEQFIEVMKAYQQTLDDYNVRSLDLSATHSWDEVMRLVKDSEAKYLEAGRSGPRRVTRFIGAYSESVLPFLRLIPNGFYTSIICGGLRLVFEAAVNISTKREKVLAILLRIPDIILQAEHSVETFYPDPALYDKAEELYLAILGAIEGAVEWLKEYPLRKQARSLMQGSRYSKCFTAKQQALDHALMALERRAASLRDNAIVTTQKTAGRVESVVNQVAVTGSRVDSRTKTTLRQVQNLQREAKDLRFVAEHTDTQLSSVATGIQTFTQTQETINVKIDDLHGVQLATHSQVETLSDVQQAKTQAAKAMEIALETAEWREKHGRDIRRLKRQLNRLEQTTGGLTQADLLDMLNVSTEASIEDFRRVHRACQSVDPSESQFAQGIFEGARFKEWLSVDESTVIFIEGGPALTINSRFASLSLMSCLAIECLEGKEPAVVLHHFCRRHVSSRDPLQGPQGLMRSLLCQILRLFQNQINLGFTSSRRYREQLDSHNLHTMCDCFANIIRQLPVDTVLFCIIDSIDCFEKREWADDCRHVIRELQDMLYDNGIGPVFKLLVTSNVRSKYVGSAFTAKFRMLLSGDDIGGRDNPTNREMGTGARRPKARESDAFRTLRNMFAEGLDESSGLSDSDFSWGSGAGE